MNFLTTEIDNKLESECEEHYSSLLIFRWLRMQSVLSVGQLARIVQASTEPHFCLARNF